MSFQLRNVGANMCVDTKYHSGNDRFGLEPCTKDNPGLGGEQVNHFVILSLYGPSELEFYDKFDHVKSATKFLCVKLPAARL